MGWVRMMMCVVCSFLGRAPLLYSSIHPLCFPPFCLRCSAFCPIPPHCELVGGRVGFLSIHSGSRRPSFGLAHTHTHTHGRIQTHTDTVPLDRARIASHHIHRISTVFSPRPSSGLRFSACIVTLCPSIRTLHFQHPIDSRGLTISPDLRSPGFFPRTRTRTRTGPNLSRAISRFSLQIKKT